jgi:hypothetical protein
MHPELDGDLEVGNRTVCLRLNPLREDPQYSNSRNHVI